MLYVLLLVNFHCYDKTPKRNISEGVFIWARVSEDSMYGYLVQLLSAEVLLDTMVDSSAHLPCGSQEREKERSRSLKKIYHPNVHYQ